MIYIVDNSSSPKIPTNCCDITTIDDVVSYCEDKPVLGIDTETEGFDFTCKKMIMFQIGDLERQYVIDTRFVSIAPLRDVLESEDIISALELSANLVAKLVFPVAVGPKIIISLLSIV